MKYYTHLRLCFIWLYVALCGFVNAEVLAAGIISTVQRSKADPVWGDVNDDGFITNHDGLILLEYAVGNDVGEYQEGVDASGDVDANGVVTAADAYIVMSRHVDPDNPALPARIGQPVGDAHGASVDSVYAVLYRNMDIAAEGDLVTVVPGVAVDNGRLGSATATLNWSPGDYAYDGVGRLDALVSYNDNVAANGSITLAGMTFDPAGVVLLPSVRLRRLSPDVTGNISLHVEEASLADTFELVDQVALVRVVDSDVRPTAVMLEQNIPNPFNPETVIRFNLPERMSVRLEVYSSTGQLVRILTDGILGSGSHQVVWDGGSVTGTPVASGIYFYRIVTPRHAINKRMLLLR